MVILQTGATAIINAAVGGRSECVESLIAGGANINATDKVSIIVKRNWCYAAYNRYPYHCICLYLQNGCSALHWAARNDSLPTLQALLNAGANMNSQNNVCNI